MTTAIPLSVSWALMIHYRAHKLPTGLHQKRTKAQVARLLPRCSYACACAFTLLNGRLRMSRYRDILAPTTEQRASHSDLEPRSSRKLRKRRRVKTQNLSSAGQAN